MTAKRVKRVLAWMLAPALACQALPALAQPNPSAPVVVTVDARAQGPKIAPDIFGQFAEHLGTGIYGGVWVGPDSPIPESIALVVRPLMGAATWGSSGCASTGEVMPWMSSGRT